MPDPDPRRSRLRALAAVLVAVALAVPAVASAGSPRPVILVDRDGRATAASCDAGPGGSATRNIGKAVRDAAPGTTILVCPGRYRPFAVAGKRDLTIRGVVPWRAVIRHGGRATPGGDPDLAGIAIAGSRQIVLQWLTVRHQAPLAGPAGTAVGCRPLLAGILVVASRSVEIRGNRVRSVGPGSLDGPCPMSVGIMVGDATPLLAGAPAALAALGDPVDPATSALIASNRVRGHAFLGIAATSSLWSGGAGTGSPVSGPTRARIVGNSIFFRHPPDACTTSGPTVAPAVRSLLLPARGLARLVAAASGVLHPSGRSLCVAEAAGIYQGVPVPDSPIPGASGRIARNRVFSSAPCVLRCRPAGAVQVAAILVADPAHRPGASRVTGNLLFRNLIGIALADAAGAVVAGNRATEGLIGITVGDTVGATLRANTATGNRAGIVITNAPVGTTGAAGAASPAPWQVTAELRITGNDARGNVDRSCEDETVGGGSRGTANRWWGNAGERGSSTPGGLCGAPGSPPPVPAPAP